MHFLQKKILHCSYISDFLQDLLALGDDGYYLAGLMAFLDFLGLFGIAGFTFF